jgi:hypothetical protein
MRDKKAGSADCANAPFGKMDVPKRTRLNAMNRDPGMVYPQRQKA